MNTIRSICLFILVALQVFSAGAIELPDIGDSAGTAISPDKERKLGEGLLRRLQGEGAVMDDPETVEYLQSIGAKLVVNSDDAGQEYNFFPVNAFNINAFAAPGGFVGVNAGLIISSRNESELAGVLAHEISHVTQRHMARAFERAGQMSLPVAIAMIGALLLGSQNPNAGTAALAAVQAGAVQHQIDFTRANEQEADRVGMALLSRAGFDPAGMPSFFERLQMANRLTDPKQLPEYLRTHPVTESRIADSKNRLRQYPPHDYTSSDTYYLTKARMLVYSAKSSRHAVKVFESALNDGSYAHEDAARYGYALALIAAADYKKARRELDQLLVKNPENVSYLLALAQLESAAGDSAKALSIYAQLNRLYPGYRPIVMKYAKALLQANKVDEARALLLDYGILHTQDRTYYELLAEAEGRAGSTIDAHLALAEFHYLSGETERARDQLKFAERAQGMDYYHRQRVHARLQQFEDELKEEEESKI